MRWMVAILMVVGGCAHHEQSRAQVPQPVTQYRVEAQDLDQHNPDPMHHDAVQAMRTLADAVRALPADTTDMARDIDAQADAIARSPESDNHSGPTRAALDDAVVAMERVPNPHPALTTRIQVARLSIDHIDPSVPYLQQKAVIDAAFYGVSNAMVLASLPRQARAVPLDWREQRLDRYVFDQMGPSPDVTAVCGPAGARQVVLKRRAGDLALTVLTIGFYTPVHVKVYCRRPLTVSR